MTRAAQPSLSVEGQQALDLHTYALKRVEDLSIRNYLSDLRQFIAWCESGWCEKQDEPSYTPQAVVLSLLIRYRTYLQTMLWLKPSSINRTLMSLKRYFAWAVRKQLIQDDPTRAIKFVPKEAPTPRHLSDEEEDVLVAAVNAYGTLRDRTIITLLLHTRLQAQELCTLTCNQMYIGKRNGTLRIIGKRKKVREIPLNATVRSILLGYLETLPQGTTYLFPSEKIRDVLTERALGHLNANYAQLAQALDVSPHDLCHRFGYCMVEVVPLHRLAQIMGHDSLDTTMLYIRGTKQDLQHDVEKIAWT